MSVNDELEDIVPVWAWKKLKALGRWLVKEAREEGKGYALLLIIFIPLMILFLMAVSGGFPK